MLNRRKFLTVLGSGVVGLSLVDVEWIPTPIESTAPLPSKGLLKGLDQITAAIAREIGAGLGYPMEFVPGDYSLGLGGMTDQFNVSAGWSEAEWQHGIDHESCIAPIVAIMAERVRDQGIRKFGALPIPHGFAGEAVVATDQLSGVTVRGLRHYDLGVEYEPSWITRFDILGARAA